MSSNELFEKMDKVLEKLPESRHSYYQLKYFVLGKEPTTQAQLWQCLRELQSRKETIQTINLQIADTEDDVELLDIEMEKYHSNPDDLTYTNSKLNDIHKREEEVKVRKLKRKRESLLSNINKLNKKLQYEIQEARFFLQAYEALEKIESLKDYDDYEAQKELWEAKIAEEVNLRILTKQPLPSDLLKTALSLHSESNIKGQVTNLLDNCRNQLQIVCEKESNARKKLEHK